MIMAVELTVSKIGNGLRSDESGNNEMDYNSLKCSLRLPYIYTVEFECILNGLPG